MARNGSKSPFLNGTFQTTPTFPGCPFTAPAERSMRCPSTGSVLSPTFGESGSGDETQDKQRCTYSDYGEPYEDPTAHMLTHQHERPDKCPIQTCDYDSKGFARKYGKNHHTLTHYKGTMICDFCPGSGPAAEKSFNRVDAFKRHLTAVHAVEQTRPNGRQKALVGMGTGGYIAGYAPGATGKCSTCSRTFPNAHHFYEHLDGCVLRMVQQDAPSEAINARCLAEVDKDKDVQETLERNFLVTTPNSPNASEEMSDADEGASFSTSSHPKRKGNPPGGVQKSLCMTHSRVGVTLNVTKKGRKNRDWRYPPSWGCDRSKMALKHRVLVIFDGPRRLAKDDMALSTAHEVRIRPSKGKSYTTDLDVQTVQRAQDFHSATQEEKDPWISDDPSEAKFHEMQRCRL